MAPGITVGSASIYPDLEALERAMAAHRGYGRWGTENHRQLETAVAALEACGQDRPVAGLAVASGMAAIAIALLTEMSAGDHLVAAHDCYGTTLTFLRDDLSRFGLRHTVVDVQDLDAVRAAVEGRTRFILCEVSTNPLVRLPDLKALAAIAGDAGALLLVDNTVPTPALCRPLQWGADVVVHSATKNLSGHADVIGGLLIARPAWLEGARALARTFGPTLGPFDAWLTLRGLRTLALRMERHSANALELARHLEHHPGIRRVFYPGLEGSPFFDRARQLLPDGAGALFSFELEDQAAADRMVRRLKLARLMPSLGHVATTISHPLSTSHRGLDKAALERAGIGPGLLRCSAGLESIDDLVEDFDQALSA
jgi:cystathionine beta-lyase/cystathionine gamma-synthase